MNWTEQQIKYVVQDLTEENSLACRALLQLSDIEFTTKIPTMAVTISKSPVLLINLQFCQQYLETENDVKTLLIHEFLHVLLSHTEKYEISNPLLNIALDAIINAIIYRYKGMEYAGFFVRFYKWEKMSFLLRPQANGSTFDKDWMQVHDQIYKGKYCADDLYELLKYLTIRIKKEEIENIELLGDHTDKAISNEMKKVLCDIFKKMDGTLIWNRPSTRGLGEKLNLEKQEIQKYKHIKWAMTSLVLLKKCLLPDEKTKKEETSQDVYLPVISSIDRRSLARYNYSGMIPFSKNEFRKVSPSHLASIYLDVSGSMDQEIADLVSLLFHFRSFIKLPLWVFSCDVAEARFIGGDLEFHSTGGTSIGPVFDHMRKNNVRKSVIITDGYIETITPEMLKGLKKENIQVLVSAFGNPQNFHDAGIPYQQLKKL